MRDGEGKDSNRTKKQDPSSEDPTPFVSMNDYRRFTKHPLSNQGTEATLPAFFAPERQEDKMGLSPKQLTGFENSSLAFGGNSLAVDLAYANLDAHEDGVSTLDDTGRFTGYQNTPKRFEKKCR
jgi:hypothetical protein